MTRQRLFGNDLLLVFSRETNFWKALEKYALELSEESAIAMGGKMPRHPESFALRLGLSKSTASRTEIFKVLGIRETGTDQFPPESHSFLDADGFVKWYWEGYPDPKTGTVVTGRNVLKGILSDVDSSKKRKRAIGFWDRFAEYAKTLDPATIRAIGGRIPAHARSLAIRLVGRNETNVSIPRLLAILESKGSQKFHSNTEVPFEEEKPETDRKKRSLKTPSADRTLNKKGNSVKTSEISRIEKRRELEYRKLRASVKSRVLSAIREISTLCDEDGNHKNCLSYEIGEDGSVAIACSNDRVRPMLESIREYVDNTLLSQITEDTGVSVSFDWNGAYSPKTCT